MRRISQLKTKQLRFKNKNNKSVISAIKISSEDSCFWTLTEGFKRLVKDQPVIKEEIDQWIVKNKNNNADFNENNKQVTFPTVSSKDSRFWTLAYQLKKLAEDQPAIKGEIDQWIVNKLSDADSNQNNKPVTSATKISQLDPFFLNISLSIKEISKETTNNRRKNNICSK